MARPSEKLAESLERLRALQALGTAAIRSADLSRTHRERLLRNGFLREVVKGWYIPTRPDEPAGESTAWYACFWSFCATYLNHRFGTDWCLSPEQSLALHAGNRMVPRQLLVRSPKGQNNILALPHGTSLLDVRAALPEEKEIVKLDGLRLYTLPAALVACPPRYFRQNPTDVRTALSLVRDASEVLELLLEGGHSTIAGRLAGAFRNIGHDRIADEIKKTMQAAGYSVRETDPFEAPAPRVLATGESSPWANRTRLLWQEMREDILKRFPSPPGLPKERKAYLRRVADLYVTDAYHSLSIEGYEVTLGLIERVRGGNWNPDANESDREQRNALAARGYWQAFQRVEKSVIKVLEGANPGQVAEEDHGDWHRQLFAPGVAAGLLRPTDLAGYRNGPIHIRHSMHVPPNPEAVRDAMPAFFELLREEPEPAVRVVLGHFLFTYIHPYTDGNGRMARFLMNLMLASGGWEWMVIPMEKRNTYMGALEEASVREDIGPFADFLGSLIRNR